MTFHRSAGASRVIFDLDGTLALVNHRRTLAKRNFKAFERACVDDPPNVPVIEAYKLFKNAGYTMTIFSGRSQDVWMQTMYWLRLQGIEAHHIRMRASGDTRADHIVKREFLDELYPEGDYSDILCVFDDRNQVVDLWRSLDIPCFQVAPGDF